LHQHKTKFILRSIFGEGEYSMKNWMRRFGILTVLGALVCSALVAGCGGGGEEEEAPTANATKPADDAGADE
jgi:hypothetical protein